MQLLLMTSGVLPSWVPRDVVDDAVAVIPGFRS
jgi:hypothetical protein